MRRTLPALLLASAAFIHTTDAGTERTRRNAMDWPSFQADALALELRGAVADLEASAKAVAQAGASRTSLSQRVKEHYQDLITDRTRHFRINDYQNGDHVRSILLSPIRCKLTASRADHCAIYLFVREGAEGLELYLDEMGEMHLNTGIGDWHTAGSIARKEYLDLDPTLPGLFRDARRLLKQYQPYTNP